jgi:hypothetical protein
MQEQKHLGRRKFLKASAFGIVGTGLAAKEGWAEEKKDHSPPKIKDYRILGRTGFKVSDLAVGSVQEEGLMAAMLDAGINYIDTAESYPGHHKKIGNVIKERDRSKLFINSKMLMEGDTTKNGLIKRVQQALEDLGTDYIDCMMMHLPENVDALKHEDFHAAMNQFKSEGRIRFAGASHHGSFWFKDSEQAMDKVLLAAAEDGRFDVFLFAYNFLQMDRGDRVLDVCKEKNIGTALMKTTPVTNYYRLKSGVERLEKEGKDIHPLYQEGMKRFKDRADRAEQFIQKYGLKDPQEIRAAAIKFALSNPHVNTVCCTLRTYDELDRVVSLSGQKLENRDKALLSAYKKGCGDLYCRHACGLCEPQCPSGVPVNTIMRYHQYFIAQGREREAMLKYAHIPGAKADVCSQCTGYCEDACPYHVPIQGLLILAHNFLTMA